MLIPHYFLSNSKNTFINIALLTVFFIFSNTPYLSWFQMTIGTISTDTNENAMVWNCFNKITEFVARR